jgi:type I restriction enzyme S subunit
VDSPCFVIDTAYSVSPIDDSVDRRWLYYCLCAIDFKGISQDVGVPGLSREAAYSTPVPLPPPLSEQRRIADFLDAETARIDQVVSIRINTTQLVKERMNSAIDRLVRGQHLSATKKADYEPFGKIPSDWGQGRLRSLPCVVQTGPFGSQLHADDYIEGGWPVVNPSNIFEGKLIADERVTVSDETRSRLSRYILAQNDVVFGRRGELGRAAVVRQENVGWVCGTGALRVRFTRPAFDAEFLGRLLGIPAVRFYFETQAVGSTIANLNESILLNMPVLIPPLHVQIEIARICSEVESTHRSLLQAFEQQITLLTERKQALIAAAVTGQFDVTTARGADVS